MGTPERWLYTRVAHKIKSNYTYQMQAHDKRYIYSLLFFTILFLCATVYNLTHQYSFTGDSARDTLASLRLLVNPAITLIGPPLSFGLNTTKEVYFSSIIYYLGAAALWISNLNPIAPVFVSIIINLSGLIPLYAIAQKELSSKKLVIITMLLYSINPIIITYSRIFWNPSPIIGLSLWAIRYQHIPLIFGLLCGLLMHFHYISIMLFIYGLATYAIGKKYRDVGISIVGFLFLMSPFIYFELKNKFYLSQTFIYNMQHSGTTANIQEKIQFFLTMPVHVLGLIPDFFGRYAIDISSISLGLGIMIWIILFKFNYKKSLLYFVVISSLTSAIFSRDYIHIQYFFIAQAIFLILLIYALSRLKANALLITLLLCISSINTYTTISANYNSKITQSFPTIPDLSYLSQIIIQDHNPSLRTNITENITV
jgi:hypothetical protein